MAVIAVAGCGSPSETLKSGPAVPATKSNGSSRAAFHPLDLSAVANAPLSQLEGVPAGDQTFNGIYFRLGPRYLQLAAQSNARPPRQLTGLAVDCSFNRLHLLHAAQGGGFQQPGHAKHQVDGIEIGRYVLHYRDGRQEVIPLVYGENVRDWWNWDRMQPTPSARIAWTGENPAARKYNIAVRLYQATRDNPYPDEPVASIDFVSTFVKAAPVCLAITIEGANGPVSAADRAVATRQPAPSQAIDAVANTSGGSPPTTNSDEQRPHAESIKAQQARVVWFARVREAQRARTKSATPVIDALSDKLIQAALRASEARDHAAKSRLAEERNRFVENPHQLPKSPEVRDETLSYAGRRIEQEQSFLERLQALAAAAPAEATDDERRVLADELAMTDEAIAKLTAARKDLVSLPAVSVATVASDPAIKKAPGMSVGAAVDGPPKPSRETILAKKEFLGPPPADWTASADPPRETPTFPAKLPYETLDNVSAMSVLYPRGRTAFLAAAEPKTSAESYLFYNLRTGKLSGEARGFDVPVLQGQLEGPSLSADGRYLAVSENIDKRILVGDVRERKSAAVIECDFFAPVMLFPTPDQLLVMDASATKQAVLWELPSGKQIRSFTLRDELATEASTALASPGGRYLAVVAAGDASSTEVHFYDLSRGEPAGTLRVNGGGVVKPRFNAIGFSANGREFAGFVFGVARGLNAAEALVCWDLESGRPVYQEFIDDGREGGMGLGMLNAANRTEPLQWFPDGQGWLLFQRYIVDREAAAVIDVVQGPGEANHSNFGTKILDDRRVMIADILQKFRVIEVKRKRGE